MSYYEGPPKFLPNQNQDLESQYSAIRPIQDNQSSRASQHPLNLNSVIEDKASTQNNQISQSMKRVLSEDRIDLTA